MSEERMIAEFIKQKEAEYIASGMSRLDAEKEANSDAELKFWWVV